MVGGVVAAFLCCVGGHLGGELHLGELQSRLFGGVGIDWGSQVGGVEGE